MIVRKASKISRRQFLGLARGGMIGAGFAAAGFFGSGVFVLPVRSLLASPFQNNLYARARRFRQIVRRLAQAQKQLHSYFEKSDPVDSAELEHLLAEVHRLKALYRTAMAEMMGTAAEQADEVSYKYSLLSELIETRPTDFDVLMGAGYFDWLDQLEQEIDTSGVRLNVWWRNLHNPYPSIKGVPVAWSGPGRWQVMPAADA